MKFAIRHLAALTIAASSTLLGTVVAIPAAQATQFSQQEVNQDRFVVVASPVSGGRLHQLLILEQVSNQRDCWRETGSGGIDPLLVNFDFTGICNRSTDSNGYSLRVGGEDMGWRYSFRIERRDNALVLLAVPNADRNSPPLEIGRSSGISTDFMQIQLNPGWRLTRRTYNGQSLGHVYLTHDQDINTLVAAATPTQPVRPATTTPTPPSTRPSLPAPTTPTPATPTPPPATRTPSVTSNASGDYAYRVVVRLQRSSDEDRVRAIVPDAFRTRIDGQDVMQAGVFRELDIAEDRVRQLARADLQAGILPVQGLNLPTNPTPTTTQPPRTQPVTNLPSVPTSGLVIAIDAGHGGRDPGAIGLNGLRETDINLDISQQVASLLQQQGVQVVMTRRDDREIDLAPRVQTAESARADIFVSIHANAAGTDANGVETYYYSTGYALAQAIQSSIVSELDVVDRGVKQARFYVLTQTSMPSALVEVGFVTGRQDASRLRDPAYRTRMAQAIARGILRYIQQQSI
jgi:N-acetylmuramoyl-L-alanine amidase